jgi:predicted nucleic acid-binding protein
VKEHVENDSGVISIQVLQEFYQVATRKIERPISADSALQFMQFMSAMDIVIADFDMVTAAVHLHRKHSLSFWDALIVQAAKSAGCSVVLSEDFQHEFRVDNLVVKNPFLV